MELSLWRLGCSFRDGRRVCLGLWSGRKGEVRWRHRIRQNGCILRSRSLFQPDIFIPQPLRNHSVVKSYSGWRPIQIPSFYGEACGGFAGYRENHRSIADGGNENMVGNCCVDGLGENGFKGDGGPSIDQLAFAKVLKPYFRAFYRIKCSPAVIPCFFSPGRGIHEGRSEIPTSSSTSQPEEADNKSTKQYFSHSPHSFYFI